MPEDEAPALKSLSVQEPSVELEIIFESKPLPRKVEDTVKVAPPMSDA
jgi:hypothetical protein